MEKKKINMSRKIEKKENYLERIPLQSDKLNWSEDGKGIVTLEIENKGFINRVFQKLLKKPKISYIHLDELGSFVWKKIDGKKSVLEIGKEVEEKFSDKANPLYERLSGYFGILESYGFVNFKSKCNNCNFIK